MSDVPGYDSWLGSDRFIKWVEDYKSYQANLLNNVSSEHLQHIINKLSIAAKLGNRIFICGNGGSLSNAQHFICDLNKGASEKLKIQLMGHALGSNPSLSSALSNDYSYADIFEKELQYYKPEMFDILIGLSVSGNSENVFRAMKSAKSIGMHTIAITGCGTAKIGDVADYHIAIKDNHFGRVEDTTMSLLHMCCYFFMENCRYEKRL